MRTPHLPALELRPLLRGWLHLVCAVLAVPAGAILVSHADEGRAVVGAAVYSIGMVAMFGVSATYHRIRWTARTRPWLKRADHAAIFVMIAGSYTPLCLVTLRDTFGSWLLAGVWASTALGVLGAFTGIAEKRIVGLVAYSAMGWAAAAAMPALFNRLGGWNFVLLIVGGVLYSGGSIILGTRWPRGVPHVFGYHEIWHVFVVVAVVLHFIVVWDVVG